MDCDKAILQVYAYLDGELTMWKRVAITRHLDECSPCLQGFSFEVELRRVIVSKCSEEVPDALRNRIAQVLGMGTDLGSSSGPFTA